MYPKYGFFFLNDDDNDDSNGDGSGADADRLVDVAVLSSVNLSLSTEAVQFHVSPLSCSISGSTTPLQLKLRLTEIMAYCLLSLNHQQIKGV